MPERERKQKQAPEKRVEEEVDVAAPAKQGEELKEGLDDLLDEIDSVLEADARRFVKSLCTKRGGVTYMSVSGSRCDTLAQVSEPPLRTASASANEAVRRLR